MDDLEEMAQRILMIADGKLAYDGDFDGLRDITGNMTRFIVTMDYGKNLNLENANLLNYQNNIYEYEINLEKTPIKYILTQLSQVDGVRDVEIRKMPIEKVISELYGRWRKK
jgi:ABC-2 type transport system ATP-binding protein